MLEQLVNELEFGKMGSDPKVEQLQPLGNQNFAPMRSIRQSSFARRSSDNANAVSKNTRLMSITRAKSNNDDAQFEQQQRSKVV